MKTERRARKPEKVRSRPGQGASQERKVRPKPDAVLVVGLGASAGGLEALTKFFDALSADTGMAFVLIQHLDPTHKSMMVDLLAGHTTMPVLEAANDTNVERNHVYIIPPGAYLAIREGALRVEKLRERRGARMPFDFFLKSLADDCGARAACVVLSGTGSDGSLGLEAIHDKGGLVIAQDPNDASHDSMPRSAIMTGAVNFVLPAAKIPASLVKYSRRACRKPKHEISAPGNDTNAGLAEIIDLLRAHTSRDFALYKEGTLLRQIQRRMVAVSIKDIDAYLKMIRKNPVEIDLLAKDLLINVTRFFRDATVFKILAESVIPGLVRLQPLGQPLRIWDAGCSTGEETYSITMLLLEEIASAKRDVKVQVFASDIDNEAITIARNGFYPASIENDLSPARLGRFFIKEDHGYRVTRELRETVVFATQDLLADAPFSRVDIVICRNVLIYLRPEVQEKVLSLFHFALREGGFLILGASETIGGFEDRFEPISRKHRIFRHLGGSRPGEVIFPIAPTKGTRKTRWAPLALQPASTREKAADIAQQLLLEAHAPASVLINARHEGVYFFGPVDRFLMVAAGRADQTIFAMARGGLRSKLRVAIRQAERKETRVAVGAEWMDSGGNAVAASITVEPIQIETAPFLLVSFIDKPEHKISRKEASDIGDAPHLVELEQELDAVRQELESAIHELEITNDELMATNEEAMSVNEELQSTNEELETSKEELQSLNEELTALNSQLNETLEQQRRTADDLQNIMKSSNIATLFLDTSLRIRFFSSAAESMFRVISSDVGRPITDLSPLTKDTRLISDARSVIANHVPLSCDVEGMDAGWYTRRILPYRTQDDRVEGVVITFADISERKAAEREIEAARSYSDSVINTIRQPLVVLDEELRVISANRSFYSSFSISPEETVGRELDAVDHGRLDAPALRGFLDHLRRGEGVVENYEIDIHLTPQGMRSLLMSAVEIREMTLPTRKILVTIDDITERKKTDDALKAAKLLAEQANLGKSRFLAAASHDLRQPLQTLSLVQGILAKRIKDESGTRLLAKLEETLGAMSGMLNTLLDINQLEAGVVRPEIFEFQISSLLKRLETEFTYHTTAKQLDWRVVMCRLKVRSDPRLLEQMLRNLLSNAVKYTARGKILLGCRQRGGKLRIEVWDTGMGIPSDQLNAIFEEFHQLNNTARERSRGLGLGLSIVQRICDLLAHNVTVRSTPGSGSTFAIEVPIAEAAQESRSKAGERTAEAIVRPCGAILIIEDDPAVREMLEILLEGEGYQTTSISSSNEAVALAVRGALLPDLIIADYNLPGDLTGVEAGMRLQESLHRDIPTIILTGDISSNTLHKIRHAGYVYLSKPAKVEVLLQQINSCLTESQRPRAHEYVPQAADSAGAPQSTVFVVDDDRAQLADMAELLRRHSYTVEAYASGEAFFGALRPDSTGCLLVDAIMPGMGGIALLERLKAKDCSLPAVMITGHGDVAMAVQAMKAGAIDFLEKPVRPDQLLTIIERALERRRSSNESLEKSRHEAVERLARLTPRQYEVMDLVIQGKPNKIIAHDLGINQRTVENHRAAVMKRVGVKSLPDLVRLVMAAA